ncbi:recombinase family protein [Roseateles asaccharophilus]|uniref:DNA invertase Pin-like site-specific DNA recombinase n=1 Tax=Roseateles asaccharophilus TaxID=582607 RepID=A0ABU2A3P6_9BURK|nr:recombinase family protein [Roseateles asaccharophilus]MDR7331779.1 DNA invertase Pin-like site-specific DNA recombinase [Roseateles asaccharophilus]
MAGLVYSYLRFSDPRQAAGHSSERQAAYAARWAAEHGLQLDESLTLRDEGLSAYHQRHVKSGALGVFLAAVEGGQVPEGSVLVVEALDRLSRAEPIQAQAQLAQIVNAGITVVTASDGKAYSRAQLKANPMDLVYSLLVMIRAHEESDTKSKRVTAAILKQCRGWQAGTWRGKVRNGKDPQWVRETAEGWELVPERAEAVREMARLYLAGQSGRRILDKLAEAGLSPVDGPSSSTHLYKILKSPALIGTKRLTVAGEEFELQGYYPAALTPEQWSELQAAGDQRVRRGGRTGAGDVPHVITGIGITYCGYCGCAMSGQNLFGKIKRQGDRLSPGYRRLLCAGQQYASGRCKYPKSRSVAPVEAALMNYCSDIMNLRALYAGDRAQPLRSELAKLRTRAAEIDAQLQRVSAALLSSTDAPATFVRLARELEEEKGKVEAATAAAERQLESLARGDVDGVDAKWRDLAAGVAALDVDARLQARQLVADTFDRITVYASGFRPGRDPADIIDVLLLAKGGVARALRIDTQGGWIAGEVQLPG